MQSPVIRNAVVIGCVLGLGIGTFAIARATLSIREPVEDSSLEYPAVGIAEELGGEDQLPFRGVMNGITFKGEAKAEDFGVPGCLPRDATDEEVLNSPLDVTVTYVPSGIGDAEIAASSCDGKLISLTIMYGGRDGKVQISRFASRSVVSHAPQGRMLTLTAADKPAVLITEQMAVGSVEGTSLHQLLIILEDFGTTSIRTFGLRQSDIVKIAEGLK